MGKTYSSSFQRWFTKQDSSATVKTPMKALYNTIQQRYMHSRLPIPKVKVIWQVDYHVNVMSQKIGGERAATMCSLL